MGISHFLVSNPQKTRPRDRHCPVIGPGFFCPQIYTDFTDCGTVNFLEKSLFPVDRSILENNLQRGPYKRPYSCGFVSIRGFPFLGDRAPLRKKRFHIALGSTHKPEGKSAALPMGLEDFGGVAKIYTRTDRSPRQFSPPRQSRALPGIQKPVPVKERVFESQSRMVCQATLRRKRRAPRRLIAPRAIAPKVEGSGMGAKSKPRKA